MIDITVLFFASLRTDPGQNHIPVQLPEGSTIGFLRESLIEKFPQKTEQLRNALATMAYRYCSDEEVITENAEVAFFPPVSGGSDTVTIKSLVTDEKIDFNQLIAEMIDDTTGAVSIFAGIVRGNTPNSDFPETSYLQYEAYQPMAEIKMMEIGREISDQWPLVRNIILMQRVGSINKGEPSVFIACSSSHRGDGIFEAARYGIDRLKEIVPVWKKEVNSKGGQWIEGDFYPEPDKKKD